MENYFTILNNINVNNKVEQKGGLTYLSWAYAWGEVKKLHPDANYTIYERDTEFGPVNYFTDGRTGWVKTGVTIGGIEHIEELPIMDNRNQSILFDAITSTDVNKAIQRSLTKAIARHGLGLYIYAGEDLPENDQDQSAADLNDLTENVKNLSAQAATTPTQAASTASKDAVSPATTSNDLTTLIKEIGARAKQIKTTYGSLEKYQDIIFKVTGNAKFKCNVATEADIPVLEKILQALNELN